VSAAPEAVSPASWVALRACAGSSSREGAEGTAPRLAEARDRRVDREVVGPLRGHLLYDLPLPRPMLRRLAEVPDESD
jgi:hypothetical protein